MNKYQKKLNKEVKEFSNDNKEYGHANAKKSLKLLIKMEPYKPCENCNVLDCNQLKNRIVYCRDKR